MKAKNLLLTLSIIIITASVTFLITFHLFFTTKGLGLVTRFLISRYAQSDDVEIKGIDGSITRVLSFQEISLGNLKMLPPGSVVEIKKIELDVNPFDLEGVYVNINGGKILVPGADPIIFYGNYTNGLLDLNIYSKSIDAAELSSFLNDKKALSGIKGAVKDIDIFIKGPLQEPELTGQLHIERLSRNVFSITDSPISLNLKFKEIRTDLKMFGETILEGGSVSGPKTAVVKLQESKIIFSGPPGEPKFDLKGLSDVEGVRINITLKGSMKEPDIGLSSEPSFPKERLLLMLATNKSWDMTEGALIKGQLSPDIARDFLDYFLFAGSGGKIAQYFGLKDVTFQFNGKTKGVGVKKDVSGNLDVSYAVEKEQDKEKNGATIQKLEGEYKLTDTIAVGAEREIKQEKVNGTQDEAVSSDKVLLKYKKSF
ncbi:MAG: translocation/assembly module TamB [Candidatus Omnitrophica bacterium]|nr:translocation/assembly module TamB [Candidatus Omnitrophota bacterium]